MTIKQTKPDYTVDEKEAIKEIRKVLDSSSITKVLIGITKKSIDIGDRSNQENKEVEEKIKDLWGDMDDSKAIANFTNTHITTVRRHIKTLLRSGIIRPDYHTVKEYMDLGGKHDIDWIDFFYKEKFKNLNIGQPPSQTFNLDKKFLFEALLLVIEEHRTGESFKLKFSPFSEGGIVEGYEPYELSKEYKEYLQKVFRDIRGSSKLYTFIEYAFASLGFEYMRGIAEYEDMILESSGNSIYIKPQPPTLRTLLLHILCDLKEFLSLITFQSQGFLFHKDDIDFSKYDFEISSEMLNIVKNDLLREPQFINFFRLIDKHFEYTSCKAYKESYLHSNIDSLNVPFHVLFKFHVLKGSSINIKFYDIDSTRFEYVKEGTFNSLLEGKEHLKHYDTINPTLRENSSMILKILEDKKHFKNFKSWEESDLIYGGDAWEDTKKVIKVKNKPIKLIEHESEILDVNEGIFCLFQKSNLGEELLPMHSFPIYPWIRSTVKKVMEKHFDDINYLYDGYWAIPSKFREEILSIDISKPEKDYSVEEYDNSSYQTIFNEIIEERSKRSDGSDKGDIGTTGKTDVKRRRTKRTK